MKYAIDVLFSTYFESLLLLRCVLRNHKTFDDLGTNDETDRARSIQAWTKTWEGGLTFASLKPSSRPVTALTVIFHVINDQTSSQELKYKGVPWVKKINYMPGGQINGPSSGP